MRVSSATVNGRRPTAATVGVCALAESNRSNAWKQAVSKPAEDTAATCIRTDAAVGALRERACGCKQKAENGGETGAHVQTSGRC
jgi:hypothetical protein